MTIDEQLALALSAGQACERYRRAAHHAFEVLAKSVDLALAAPNSDQRLGYLKQAKRLLDEILQEKFEPMPWPEVEWQHRST